MDFEFVVAQAVSHVNKMPIGFKEGLRQDSRLTNTVPEPITPELLLKGYTVPSVNILHPIHDEEIDDPTWNSNNLQTPKKSLEKLQTVRYNLRDLYHTKFLRNLADQATGVKGRYQKVQHKTLKVNDLASLNQGRLYKIS